MTERQRVRERFGVGYGAMLHVTITKIDRRYKPARIWIRATKAGWVHLVALEELELDVDAPRVRNLEAR